jgi:NAD dependent epimerase/dehydratase family enzyme
MTSPNPVSNAEFTSALAAAVHRPAVMTVPVPALKLAVGGVSSDILSSARVMPQRLLAAGFGFQHAGIAGALAAELG